MGNRNKYEFLEKINEPCELDGIDNLEEVCAEIRDKIISIVSKNGGHLASNLGVVELTVVLHKVFNGKDDKIVWDVGHQCYAHKMLTGRFSKIDTIRTEGGISGFPNKAESDYDAFTSGHSSTSISAALGLAYANELSGRDAHTIAVIGDGALTGGLSYEGLNNAGKFKKNFIVVLNDNQMSISHNVGAISRYLTYVRIRPYYMKMKSKVERFLSKVPFLGGHLIGLIRKLKYIFKGLLYDTTIFEDMGFLYYGPVAGHDINELMRVFKRVKDLNRPVLVHVVTTKGKGYKFAEQDPKQFHGVSKFDTKTGGGETPKETFSGVFGDEVCTIAGRNEKVCAITAAMKSGTGLNNFSKLYKSRFFDVGIAEEHAVTFAGGLAAGGFIPIVAVYSTFLQRAYDQIMHDVSLQNTKVIFAVDRAGFTGDDGETHQGIFDVPFLNSIPRIKIFSPSFFDELKSMIDSAVEKEEGISAIRYPRGEQFYKPSYFTYKGEDYNLVFNNKSDILIVTYGRIFSNACLAREKLINSKDLETNILKLNVIKPLNPEILNIASEYRYIFFFEESSKSGGIGETFGSRLCEMDFKGKYFHSAVEDKFVSHASVQAQIKRFSLDCDGMVNKILYGIGR